MASLESITFNASMLKYEGLRDRARSYRSPERDTVTVAYSPLVSQFGESLPSIDAVRKIVRGQARVSDGSAIIEVDTILVDGCTAVRHIIKHPQKLHGMAYLGSIILPFRDFCFVIRAVCKENGTTSMREAVVLDEAMRDGRVNNFTEMFGWMQDPYDPEQTIGFHRNLSDDAYYDTRFPGHPLARLRHLLTHIQSDLRIADDVPRTPHHGFSQ